jgi:uncharacterized protein YndB with AHSA1/START domain
VSAGGAPPRGDQARVSVRVEVEPAEAFRVFTREIDLWWRRGARYRASGAATGGILHLEPHLGGRLLESYDSPAGPHVMETGRVTAWEPPARLVLEWRGVNFAPDEATEVEVVFEPSGGATLVTLTHRGWSRIRPDHPARHGLETAAFVRMLGLFWGDLLTSLREHAGARQR